MNETFLFILIFFGGYFIGAMAIFAWVLTTNGFIWILAIRLYMEGYRAASKNNPLQDLTNKNGRFCD